MVNEIRLKNTHEENNNNPPTNDSPEENNNNPPTNNQPEGNNNNPPTNDSPEVNNNPPTNNQPEGNNNNPPTNNQPEENNNNPPTNNQPEVNSEYITVISEVDDKKELGTDLGSVLDTVFGIISYPFKLVFVVPGLVTNLILENISSVGGKNEETVTLAAIVFNKISLTDINIFSITKTANNMDVSQTIGEIRGFVAEYYYAFRNFAIVASLAVLIYVGIRMAFDNFGEKRARYKKMLVNWVVGIGLIFLLHFIIVTVIMINNSFVNMLYETNIKMLNAGNQDGIKSAMEALLEMAFDISLVKSWGAAIMYSILQVITFIFLIVYIKRMLMVCFLVMIAPLVSITYAIDKIGNNKSEMLNTWLKEFCYNVLIQPFHCISYIVFVGTSLNIMYNNMDKGLPLGAMVLAIVCIVCVFMGEKLVRTIFGFNKAKSKNIVAKMFTSSMVTKAISDIKTIKQSQQSDEEEEVPPMFTPEGKETSEQMNISKVKYVDETKNKTENRTEENNNSNNNKTPIQPEKKGHKIKKILDEKTPAFVKGIGKSYVNGLKTVTGYNAIQRLQNSQTTVKQIPLEEQFLMVSKTYQQKLNLTDKQLALRMEAISKTPMKQLENAPDVIYKQWLEYLEKGFKRKGYANPQKVMEDLIMKKDKKGENVSNKS